MDMKSIRARFPALGGGVVHVDAPGGTQLVDAAIDAMASYLRTGTANAHGRFALSAQTDELCDAVRLEVARFLGGEPDGIVFGPNMTSLTFHVARAVGAALEPGDEIVCTRLDHDANVWPWVQAASRAQATVRWVDLDLDGFGLDVQALERLVNGRTRLVAFPRASNALGTLVDPAPFVAAADAVGAITYMDAVHAAPHVSLADRGGVDVVACSPYKFFGPHLGILSADPALLADLEPEKVRPAPDTGPERWQTGTANFEGIAGTGAAIRYLLDDVGMDAIREHEARLTARFLDGLDGLDHVRLHGTTDASRRTPTFAVTVDGHTPADVATGLAEEDICVWDGHYYAVEPMRALGLLEGGGAVRIGFVHYHDDGDVDRVLDALARLG